MTCSGALGVGHGLVYFGLREELEGDSQWIIKDSKLMCCALAVRGLS